MQVASASRKSSHVQGYKDALRLSLSNQSFGNSSPSDLSLRRVDRSPRSENDPSPIVSTSHLGAGSRIETRRMRSSEKISLKSSMDKPVPIKKTTDSETEVSWFLVLLKALIAFLLLSAGLILATLVQTGGIDWIYSPSTGVSPLLSCPSTVVLFNSHSAVDGMSCELRFSFSSFSAFDSSVKSAFQPYNARVSGDLQCFQGGVYSDCAPDKACQVTCYSSDPCSVAVGAGSCTSNGFLWGKNYIPPSSDTCSQAISLGGVSYPITGAGLSAEALCGPDPQLTPGVMLTLRGELISFAFIGIIVMLALFVKTKVAPIVRSSVTSQKGMMIAKSSANELRVLVESKWDAQTAKDSSAHNGPTFETGSILNKKEQVIHPAKHFAASPWKYRVRVMHAMLRKRNARLRKLSAWRATLTSLLVVGLSFGITLLLLQILPASYPFNTVILSPTAQTDPSSYWSGNIASVFSPLYTGLPLASGVWIDAVTLADVVVEFGLVLLASIVGLRWQSLPSEREDARLAQIGTSEEACLVLFSSAGTCLKSRGQSKLVSAINSGLNDLKLGAVFVVDMGPSSAPLDDTWKIAESIDPALVHYVYLPDTNKRLGEYWLSEIWIPFMHKSGRISRLFKQMLVVDLDALDGAETLKSMTLGNLNRLLMVADGNIDDNSGTVVLMPVKSNIPGMTGHWESARLKSDYYQRMMEVGLSGGLVSSFSPSQSINIVDRRTLEVLAPVDSTQLALAAIRKRGKVQISAPSALKQFSVQNTIYEHYRTQSSLTWNSMSLFRELLLSPSSFAHGQSIAIKVFIVLGPLLNLFCLMLRPLVFGTLLFRDPVCLACLLVVFWLVSVATNSVHAFNQWRFGRSKDMDLNFGSLVSYPIYQLYLGTITIGLVIGGATYGRLSDDLVRPSVGSHKELYPCLPHADVDWFTCWKTSDASRLSVLNSAADESPRGRTYSHDSLV